MIENGSEAETGRDTADTARDTPVTARVLAVDDSPAFRMIVTRILSRAGYPVRAVEDGVTTLAPLARERFDLVVSDVSMPGFAGFELRRAFRAFPEPPEVNFLTGSLAGDFGSAVRGRPSPASSPGPRRRGCLRSRPRVDEALRPRPAGPVARTPYHAVD